MIWRLAKSLEQLRSQANALWPDRSKASDGTIGDAAHAATASDHNPNDVAVVCAFDLTHDPANGVDCAVIAEAVRQHPHPDLKYLIWDHRMFSAYARAPYAPFEWRPYSGDPHTNHIHFSVGVGTDGRSVEPYDDETPWTLTTAAEPPIPKPHEEYDMVPAPYVDDTGRLWVFEVGIDQSLWASVDGGKEFPVLDTRWGSGLSVLSSDGGKTLQVFGRGVDGGCYRVTVPAAHADKAKLDQIPGRIFPAA